MRSENTFTISHVSQQTGVATITLRAWERRYGLIKPKRTAKGHRVYSQENIDQIQKILTWINRGVAIRKVPALLANEKKVTSIVTNDDHWLQIQQDLLTAIISLKQRSLNPLLDQLNKSTPLITLSEKVYQPLEILMVQRWQQKPLGYQLEQQLWQQCWQRQNVIMALRADKQISFGCCYLVNLAPNVSTQDYYLLYALLLQAGVRVISIDAVKDIAGLTRLNTGIDNLMLFSVKRLENSSVKQLSKLVENWQGNIICTGPMADIHSEQLRVLAVDFAGGRVSDFYQSPSMQGWLTRIEQA